MSKLSYFMIRVTFGLILFAGAFSSISAQMTIFNIPTTDTLPRASFYLEADFITKPVSYRKGGFQTYGYRAVYGLNHKTEVGANFYYTRDGGDAIGEMQFNAKRSLYRNEKRGVAISSGALMSLPLRSTRDARRFVMVYSNASKTVKPLNGLRVTGGVYTVFSNGRDFGTKTGAMVGIEQPIYKRISFLADWYSGKNRFGYSAAGLNYAITKRQFILAGYNFGNAGRGNNAFSAYYGYTF